MPRGLKKFLYGLLYILIIAFVVWGILSLAGFKFEKEEPIEPKEENYLSVKVIKAPKFFQLDSGETAFLVQLNNPNPDVEVSFSYKFIVKGAGEKLLKEVRGVDTLLPEMKEFIFDLDVFEDSVNSVDIEIFSEEHSPTSSLLKEDVEVKEVVTSIEDERVRITGVLENKSLLSLFKVKLIGVLVDKFGFQLYTGGTVLNNVDSFGEKEFEIFIPVDEKIKEDMQATSTQVYINLE